MIIQNCTGKHLLFNVGACWKAEPEYTIEVASGKEESISIPELGDLKISVNEV